ncbi:MAG: winged helix-turn-helix transcriptional regulator [Hyphomonas sp.]|nr:winged helix-turn-helix transcriptional regulator [Hyphomonas sp.]
MTYVDALSALSDPTRRQVLEALRAGPMAVTDIAARLPVSRPAVSQHLKRLAEAGLVQAEAAGTRRLYSVRREGLEPLRRYLDSYWDDVLVAFRDFAEKEDKS